MLKEWVKDTGALNIRSDVSGAGKERYVNKLSVHGRNQRLVITRKGFLGLGVNSCVKGDIVCVLFGCSTPVLLRMVGEYYNFLEEAYLHGIMNGEVIDGLERRECTGESFYIW